jgi:NAD(P)-dependent dehydrogenase (short-subunit alcohol dehydrogenase family)
VAVITGAGGGIGQATAVALARRGMRLCLVERDAGRLAEAEKAARDAANGPLEILAITLDVTSEGDMEAMAARALEAYGRIDVLVTAAGILRPPGSGPKTIAEMSINEFDRVLAVNLRGTFLATRAVLPSMLKARSGHIIHISSTSGLRGRAFDGAYCASKFAVLGFSESLAEEIGRSGVRVHTLLPDAVATPLWEQNGPVPMPADALPPERVADFITYLIELPEDCVLLNPVLTPFGGRRRKRKLRDVDSGSSGKGDPS